MAPLSRKKIDQLGDRLRRPDSPSVDDVRLLAEYRDEHLPVLAKVLHRVCELGLRSTVYSARQKNAQTIIEKLRRAPKMEFSNMQDIAGARIVLLEGGRLAQDEAVQAISGAFADHKKVLDRRAEPRCGYRAVHIPVKQDGYVVEIQVRTHMQDRWAQLFERLGDHLGRQIRYGEPPDDPQALVRPGAPVTRAELVDYTLDISDQVADSEGVENTYLRLQRYADGLEFVPPDVRDGLAQLRHRIADNIRNTAALVEAIRKVVPDGVSMPVQITPAATTDGKHFPHFLIAYRRSTGTLVECTGFDLDHIDSIIARRTEIEQAHRDDPDYEVVLLASHSEGDLLRTHARYFKNLSQLASKRG